MKSKQHSHAAIEARRYHHGGLRDALIAAALAIAEEQGVAAVTVRAAGARAGVSSAAPFRHFATKTALMTAVAEEAMRRLRREIDRALSEATAPSPLARFHRLGIAYLRWVTANPTHFEIVSTRAAIDFAGSAILTTLNDEIQDIMSGLLGEARAAGELRAAMSDDLAAIPLQARAMMYGLGRMWVDGQFAQWGGEGSAPALMRRSLNAFIVMLARDGYVLVEETAP